MAAWETTNLLTVGSALLAAAQEREETRGSHWREDHPDRDDTALAAAPRRHDGRRRAAAARRRARMSTGMSELTRAGLDPQAVQRHVAAAVAEDLPGEDVTSVATLDPRETAWADLVARAPGVVAGLPVAELVFRHVVGDALDVKTHVADGDRVRARRRAAVAARPGAGTAHRGAHGAQLPVSPVRRRHRDVALGGRRSRAPEPGCVTPARRRPACGPWRSTPCAAAAGSTTAPRCRTRHWSRTTTCSRPAAWWPPTRRCATRYPDLPVQVEVTTIEQLASPARRRARTRSCWTTWTPRRWPRRSA